ncbi:DUF4292 domain-containing protein [Pseudopedobacter beijingensis]|uniref:DUF4292 domain-containing protein n=1 Tax=Pseudopedobacter beijingensis TaxID=1207056 RepID=A0ABW4IAF8_9SPHI
MKESILNRYLFLLVVVLLSSCAVKKTYQEAKQEVHKETVITVADIISKETQYNTLNYKAKTNMVMDEKSYDVNLNLRNKQGEVIWISVTYLGGLEAARLMITPDSLKLLNRLTSEYLQQPFSYIQNYTSNLIDYKALEAFLVGNTPRFMLIDDLQLKKSGELFVLEGKANDLDFTGLFSLLLKPQKLSVKNTTATQNLDIDYSSFVDITNKRIPLKINLNSKFDDKNVRMNMEIRDVVFDTELSFPFSVPKRFTVIE